ncbi:MAG TPA: hypothetical protein VFX34_02605, partial [Sporosarcina sp.]|nr:hypothetical protein [Sporosarcina sp.]
GYPKTLFLNTRTMREFDFQPQSLKMGRMFRENVQSPRLVGPVGWKVISDSLVASGWKDGEPLLIVSPTPVYGIGLIETVLHSYVYPLRAVGVPVNEILDFEAWKYNGKGFSHFLEKIFEWRPSHTIILSGDVHYSSGVTTCVKSNGSSARIVQFTSSPSKNMSFSGIWGFLMKRMIAFNAWKRRGKKIRRHCDESFVIVKEEKHTSCPETPEWTEVLEYVPMNKKSIVETENTIGKLTLFPNIVENTLLHMKGDTVEEFNFERVELD